MLLCICLFFAVYIIVSYSHIQLYKRQVSIFWIRVALICGWLLYFCLFHDSSKPCSDYEFCAFWASVLAHLLTGDYYSCEPSPMQHIKPDTPTSASHTESRNNFVSWLSSFLILAWIFDDDDE